MPLNDHPNRVTDQDRVGPGRIHDSRPEEVVRGKNSQLLTLAFAAQSAGPSSAAAVDLAGECSIMAYRCKYHIVDQSMTSAGEMVRNTNGEVY